MDEIKISPDSPSDIAFDVKITSESQLTTPPVWRLVVDGAEFSRVFKCAPSQDGSRVIAKLPRASALMDGRRETTARLEVIVEGLLLTPLEAMLVVDAPLVEARVADAPDGSKRLRQRARVAASVTECQTLRELVRTRRADDTKN